MRERKIVTILCLFAIAFVSACGRFAEAEVETPSSAAMQPIVRAVATPTDAIATPTLAPVATDEPTAAPPTEVVPEIVEPEVIEVPRVSVSVNAAYLRDGPGTEAEIVGLAQFGTVMPVLDSDEFGNWLKVELDDGSEAWIGSTVVEEFSGVVQEEAPAADGQPENSAATSATPVVEATPAAVVEPAESLSPTAEPTAEIAVDAEPTQVVTFGETSVDPPYYPCREGQIKASYDTWTYHLPNGAFYDRTYTNVICFDTVEAAEAAGYSQSEH